MGFIPWAIVLHVVFLNLLDVMVGLWVVHAFGTAGRRQHLAICSMADGVDLLFPREISDETEDREHQSHQPEDRTREEPSDDAMILGREAHALHRDSGVDREKGHPDEHGSWNGQDGILGPHVRDQRRLAEHRGQHRRIEPRAPNPVPRRLSVGLREVVAPDVNRGKVEDEGMIEAIGDPGEERMHLEKGSRLAELV